MSNSSKESWILDQITKSNFFHQKLHLWGLLDIAHELENIKGEKLKWDLDKLFITKNAWDKVIHRGIKPVLVFSHPEILNENPKRTSYYRMLSMVSQKSMGKVGLPIGSIEEGTKPLSNKDALEISKHLNKIISSLVELDEKIDFREFDLWRGMTAGSQAQGSWQNIKGSQAEEVIKDILIKRLREQNLINSVKENQFFLKNGQVLILSSEPDVGIYKDEIIQIATEIKGGIDTAGVLERFGAALKSLKRSKEENNNALTILIMQKVSLTKTVIKELNQSKNIIDKFFTIEEIISNEKIRKELFSLLGI